MCTVKIWLNQDFTKLSSSRSTQWEASWGEAKAEGSTSCETSWRTVCSYSEAAGERTEILWFRRLSNVQAEGSYGGGRCLRATVVFNVTCLLEQKVRVGKEWANIEPLQELGKCAYYSFKSREECRFVERLLSRRRRARWSSVGTHSLQISPVASPTWGEVRLARLFSTNLFPASFCKFGLD